MIQYSKAKIQFLTNKTDNSNHLMELFWIKTNKARQSNVSLFFYNFN